MHNLKCPLLLCACDPYPKYLHSHLCKPCFILHTAPSDYTPGEYLLPFSGDQKSVILTVDTVVDSIAECDESFQTEITKSSRPEKVIIVNPDTCDVVIEDNNGKLKVGCILYGERFNLNNPHHKSL